MSTEPTDQPGDAPDADVPPHLRPQTTDRGFRRLPALPGAYGGEVRVYESSSAEGPHLWLSATAPDSQRPTPRRATELGGFADEPHKAIIHLDAGPNGTAIQLVEQLMWLLKNHYYGDQTDQTRYATDRPPAAGPNGPTD